MAKAKKGWIEYAKTPEEVGVSSHEIQAFIDECIEKERELHSITIIRHGKIACEIYRDPFKPQHRHMMYSVSKSFTSTAIGFAVALIAAVFKPNLALVASLSCVSVFVCEVVMNYL